MTKNTILALTLATSPAFIPRAALAQGGVVTSTQNKMQVALLHWYPANLVTKLSAGTSPISVVSDGANIWVTNFWGNNVSKF